MTFQSESMHKLETDLERKRPLSNGRKEDKPSLVNVRNDL